MLLMSSFRVWEPGTLEQAINTLMACQGKAVPLAGGTDLLVKFRQDPHRYTQMVNLDGLAELESWKTSDEEIILGAMTKVSKLETSGELMDKCPLLAQAAGQLGSRQVRNLATVGGNLCNAAPSAELGPPLLALDASVVTVGPNGEFTVPLETFFQGPGETVLGEAELLQTIRFALPSHPWHGVYYKLSPRRAMDIAVVNVAVVLVVDRQNQTVLEGRIGIGAVAPTPLRARQAEKLLAGRTLTEELIHKAAAACANLAKPISDVRASASYREAMVYELVAQGLRECWQGVGGQ